MSKRSLGRVRSGLIGLVALGLYSCGDGEKTIIGPPISNPSISQSTQLVNDDDILYLASLTDTTDVSLRIEHEGSLYGTEMISSSNYEKLFKNMPKGNSYFIALGDTARATVPDYASEAPDFSSLNLDLDEESALVVHLKRAKDKNERDNPVRYTGVTS